MSMKTGCCGEYSVRISFHIDVQGSFCFHRAQYEVFGTKKSRSTHRVRTTRNSLVQDVLQFRALSTLPRRALLHVIEATNCATTPVRRAFCFHGSWQRTHLFETESRQTRDVIRNPRFWSEMAEKQQYLPTRRAAVLSPS